MSSLVQELLLEIVALFHDPLITIMIMVLLCFIGMLTMFLFVIRSLSAHQSLLREGLAKQQGTLAELERQMMDLHFIVRTQVGRPESPEVALPETSARRGAAKEALAVEAESDISVSVLAAAAALVADKETARKGKATVSQGGGKNSAPLETSFDLETENAANALIFPDITTPKPQAPPLNLQELFGGPADLPSASESHSSPLPMGDLPLSANLPAHLPPERPFGAKDASGGTGTSRKKSASTLDLVLDD